METPIGMRVKNERLSCLLYSDNIVTMSEKRDELQSMLDVVGGYGRDFQAQFSGEMGWCLFGERVVKAWMAYKVRLSRMSYAGWPK